MALPPSGWLGLVPGAPTLAAFPLPRARAGVWADGCAPELASELYPAPAAGVLAAGDNNAAAVRAGYDAEGRRGTVVELHQGDAFGVLMVDWLNDPKLKRRPRPLVVTRLEIWTDLQIAGGRRLAFFRDFTGLTEVREHQGPEKLRIALPRTAAAWDHIRERRVIRMVMANGSWEEWRIVGVDQERTAENALLGTVECDSVLYDLANGLVERQEANGAVVHDFDVFGLLPAEAAALIVQAARPYFDVGVVEPVDRVDVSIRWDNPLGALRALAAAAKAELEVVRDPVTGRYVINIVREIAADLPPVDIRFRGQQRALKRSAHAAEHVTRVYPRGAEEEGFSAGIAAAAWEVDHVVGGSRVQLLDEPVGIDGMLDGLYAEPVGSGRRIRILASIAPSDIVLESMEGIGPGTVLHVRRDAAGAHLTYLDHPAARALFGTWAAPLDLSEVPPVDNILRDPWLRLWDAGELVEWEPIGAPEITEAVDALHRRFGDSSARIVALQGEGIRSAWRPVAPTEDEPHATAQASIWPVGGQVRMELEVDCGGGNILTIPDPAASGYKPAQTSVRGRWVDDWAIAGIDLYELGAQRIRLLQWAAGGPAEWYLDAAQITLTGAGHSTFYEGRASNALWRAGVRHLQERAYPPASFAVEAVDRNRLDPDVFHEERLLIGRRTRLFDGGLGVAVPVRIATLSVDHANPGAPDLRLANQAATLSELVAQVPRRNPRGPGGGGPGGDTTGRGALSRVGVERWPDNIGGIYHRLFWGHNTAVQQAEGGRFTVRVERELDGVVTELEDARDPRLDSLPGTLAENDTDDQANAGSFSAERMEPPAPGSPGAVLKTFRYTVRLFDGAEEVNHYSASVEEHVDGGGPTDGQLAGLTLERAIEGPDVVHTLAWSHPASWDDTPGRFVLEIAEHSPGWGDGMGEAAYRAVDEMASALAAPANGTPAAGSWKVRHPAPMGTEVLNPDGSSANTYMTWHYTVKLIDTANANAVIQTEERMTAGHYGYA